MTKVYPNATRKTASEREKAYSTDGTTTSTAVVLTVWKKSLLLNCNGFTVFDGQGNLVFRVDNYIAGNKDEILLMDSAGIPLLTIRRKRVVFGDNWLVFEGDEATVKPLFTARKPVNVLNSKCLAHLISSPENEGDKKKVVAYVMEGSYAKRCCTICDNKRRTVAEIKRKEAVAGGVAFGTDVFRLIVQPDMDTTLAMAFVILLDQMFG